MTDRIAPERGVEAPVDCDRFDTLLPDYLESTLAPAARGWAEGHLAECARCRALTDDLVAITRQAQALGPLQPERDLWAGIAARIEAPVVPLGRTGEQAVPTAPPALRVERTTAPRQADRFAPTKRWLAAAAGVLVAVSVGSTYLVMRASGRTEPATVAATSPAPVTRPAAPTPDTTSLAPAPTQVAATTDTTPPGAEARLRAERLARRAASEARRFASSTDGGDAYAPVMQTYDKEIAALRAALKQRADLDSSTVAVLEKNLRLIDDAIAQSRDALRRDPHSRVVGDELTRALGLKVELLRTAVLLPSRS
jgi:hypothetical protein